MAKMRTPIKHVWFDLEGTLAVYTPDYEAAHDKLRYATYAEATGRPLTPEIADEFERLYKQQGSNSAAFRSLGLPSDYWMTRFNAFDKSRYYRKDPAIIGTLEKLKDIVPISIFTNNSVTGTAEVLSAIGVRKDWFTYIISGDDVAERKPDLHGFRLVIEKTNILADEILYVGDRVKADIRPAKAVGMQACLVYSQSDEADYCFDNFEDILSIFSRRSSSLPKPQM